MSAPGKSVRPYLKKQAKAKMVGVLTQVVECLSSKCKALSSNPRTGNKTDLSFKSFIITK
jgi:hypothetical protein